MGNQLRRLDELVGELDQRRRAEAISEDILGEALPRRAGAEDPERPPTGFEVVIDFETTRALRLTLPRSVLQEASEIIR